MKKYYLPTGVLGKALWLSNFVSKLGTYATKYGIAAAEVTDMVASEVYLMFWITMKIHFDEFKKKLTAFRDEMAEGVQPGSLPSSEPVVPAFGPPPPAVAPGIFVRATSIANRIKQHKDYNAADGQDLGIEGPEFSIDLDTVKPVVEVVMIAGRPEIRFRKLGLPLSAVEIFVKRPGDADFRLLDINVSSTYTDMEALPPAGQTAIWKYKLIYRLKNQRVGQWSDETSVVVGG